MQEGMEKREAIIESLKINFLPVTITSATTIVGFLALNFSDSPPYWHLGNITAIGIGAAWFFSITLLPVIINILPYKAKLGSEEAKDKSIMLKLANFVESQKKSEISEISKFEKSKIFEGFQLKFFENRKFSKILIFEDFQLKSLFFDFSIFEIFLIFLLSKKNDTTFLLDQNFLIR